MKAPVNRIIPFSNVDGPGNRTSIFFQGCPFQCLYCHNPETIHACIHCGECVKTCPVNALEMIDGKVVWHKDICVDCDTCLKTCQHLSSPKVEMKSVEDLLAVIRPIKPYIRGITVSGGECMVHADFLLELFKAVKPMGLTCLIDSNGAYDFSKYEELMEVCDGVMLDVKASDSAFHQELVHFDNAPVIKNLHYLLEKNKLQEIRTVLLPFHEEQNERTVRYVAQTIKDKVLYKLLRYRPFGVREEGLEKIGRNIATLEQAEKMRQIALELGAEQTVVI